MIWMTWRQHRAEALVAALLLALLGVVLLLSSREMFAAYQHQQNGTTVAACARTLSQDPICDALTGAFRNQFGSVSILLLGLTILPALAGMFLGAPLVARELERGTFRLAWTQGITQMRWMLVKIGALVVVTALLFGAFSLLLMWWRGPLDQVGGERFSYGFDLEGFAPVAYALFALVLGITAGVLVRRTLAAMAITLGGFVTLRGVVEFALRPHYVAPVSRISDPGQGNPHAYNGDWVLNNEFSYLDRHSHIISSVDVANLCSSVAKGGALDFNTCLQNQGIRLRLLNLYQPADRFWLFQGIEAAIFLGAAVLLLALTIWWVRARLS